jgi:hypothetical protein
MVVQQVSLSCYQRMQQAVQSCIVLVCCSLLAGMKVQTDDAVLLTGAVRAFLGTFFAVLSA